MNIPVFILISCALISTASLRAQTSGSTQPVGVMKISIPANTDFVFGIPLRRASEYQGVVQSISGNTITLAGSPSWATSQFVYASGTQPKTYYALIGSGAKEGLFAKITANDSGSITISPNSGDDLTSIHSNAMNGTGDVVDIVPYWTPGSLFSGMGSGTQLLIFPTATAGTNLSASAIYSRNTTSWVQGFSSANDKPLEPLQGLVIRNNNSSVVNIRVRGQVPFEKHRMLLSTLAPSTDQDIRFYYNSPVPAVLGTAMTGVNVGDQVFGFDNSATGMNKSAASIAVWDGVIWEDGLTGEDVTNTFTFVPGASYLFRKFQTSSPESFVWSSLQPYLAP